MSVPDPIVELIPASPMNHAFRIRKEINTALYGSVFECEPIITTSTRRSTSVAVKCISLVRARHAMQHATNKARAVDDPWQEWRVASMLIANGGHVNVLQYYQQYLLDDKMYLVTEYCADGDLFDYMNATPTKTISEDEAIYFMKQVVQGVHFLHSCGVAHRDLSLENVLLRNRTCKLMDFGLSMTADQVSQECAGKDYYMAPEVAVRKTYIPMIADVWSMGIMLFMMVTGSPLVPIAEQSQNAFHVYCEQGVESVLTAWGLHDQFSNELVDLLGQMLQVDPFQRITVPDILAHPVMQRNQ